jgi:hypothetical protein
MMYKKLGELLELRPQSAAKAFRDGSKVQRLTAYRKNSDEADMSARVPPSLWDMI